MEEAAAAGLDPAAGWDRTPGELADYIRAYRTRMERTAYLLFNHAATVAAMVGQLFGGRSPEPFEAFPGWISRKMQVMSDEEILRNMTAWDEAMDPHPPRRGGG